MSRTIDYYMAPHSPWTYLGHDRLMAIADQAGATVNLRPVELGRIFAASGGLPLSQRPAQRRAYRLVELRRWSRHLGLPMNVEPRHFPVAPDAAARLLIAVVQKDGTELAMRLASAMLAAVWVKELDIADPAVLGELAATGGVPAERLAEAGTADVEALYLENTQRAIDAQVFGAPSYVLDGELYWGQDRLDFLQAALGR